MDLIEGVIAVFLIAASCLVLYVLAMLWVSLWWRKR